MCLDCSIECENGYCNSKADINCVDCLSTDHDILNTILSYQTDVIRCLENEFDFSLPRIIPYEIKSFGEICETYCENAGSSSGTRVYNEGFIGIMGNGQQRVNSTQNLRADVHETTHVFTYYYLGSVPSWFSEGLSIYINTKLNCHPKQFTEVRMDENNLGLIYQKLKNGEFDIQYFNSSHEIGSLFFIGLEKDFDCDKVCVFNILKELHNFRLNCNNSCVRNMTGVETNDTNAKLGYRLITNEIIIEKIQRILGKDISSLANMLNLKRQN